MAAKRTEASTYVESGLAAEEQSRKCDPPETWFRVDLSQQTVVPFPGVIRVTPKRVKYITQPDSRMSWQLSRNDVFPTYLQAWDELIVAMTVRTASSEESLREIEQAVDNNRHAWQEACTQKQRLVIAGMLDGRPPDVIIHFLGTRRLSNKVLLGVTEAGCHKLALLTGGQYDNWFQHPNWLADSEADFEAAVTQLKAQGLIVV